MKHPFPFLYLLFFAISCSDSTSPIQQLQDQNKVESSYHFYPSTLRMLNIQNVESFNKLVSNIEKLTFMSMRVDSFDFDQILAFSTKLQKEESYDTYMEIEDLDRQYFILGKESPDKTIFLINQEGRQYIVDMAGRPDFLELPRVIESLSQQDSTETNGFSMLFDLVKKDADNAEYWRKRNEKRRKEREAEQLKQDTIARDSAGLSIEPHLD